MSSEGDDQPQNTVPLIKRLEGLATVRRPPYWTTVRSISNTGAARVVILIPLVGYWIIFNERIVSGIADLSVLLVPANHPHLPWRLFATYFGLCLVAAASFIYQACCSREVKDYPNPTEYVGKVAPDLSDIEESRVTDYLREGDEVSSALVEQIRTKFFRRMSNVTGQGFTEEDRRKVDLDRRREILQAHFDLCNGRCFPGRVMVIAFYVTGFIALMVPSVDIFWRVVGVLLRAISA